MASTEGANAEWPVLDYTIVDCRSLQVELQPSKDGRLCPSSLGLGDAVDFSAAPIKPEAVTFEVQKPVKGKDSHSGGSLFATLLPEGPHGEVARICTHRVLQGTSSATLNEDDQLDGQHRPQLHARCHVFVHGFDRLKLVFADAAKFFKDKLKTGCELVISDEPCGIVEWIVEEANVQGSDGTHTVVRPKTQPSQGYFFLTERNLAVDATLRLVRKCPDLVDATLRLVRKCLEPVEEHPCRRPPPMTESESKPSIRTTPPFESTSSRHGRKDSAAGRINGGSSVPRRTCRTSHERHAPDGHGSARSAAEPTYLASTCTLKSRRQTCTSRPRASTLRSSHASTSPRCSPRRRSSPPRQGLLRSRDRYDSAVPRRRPSPAHHRHNGAPGARVQEWPYYSPHRQKQEGRSSHDCKRRSRSRHHHHPHAHAGSGQHRQRRLQPEEEGERSYDWEALADGRGRTYYHHIPSGRTQWAHPGEERARARCRSRSTCEWEICEDRRGREFYHHVPSGRTQWELPEEVFRRGRRYEASRACPDSRGRESEQMSRSKRYA